MKNSCSTGKRDVGTVILYNEFDYFLNLFIRYVHFMHDIFFVELTT